MIEPFVAYEKYLAVKRHFTDRSYDYFKYNGKTRCSMKAFSKRNDQRLFIGVTRIVNNDLQSLITFYAVCNAYFDNPYIRDMIKDEKYKNQYLEMKGRIKTLQSRFTSWLESYTQNELKLRIKTINGQHSEIFKEFCLSDEPNFEMMVVLDHVFSGRLLDTMPSDPITQNYVFRIKRYSQFFNVDVNKYKEIMKEYLCSNE